MSDLPMEDVITRPPGHYVYLYRDERDRVRYVGYGQSASRASSHLVESHNQALSDLLATRNCRIEIAGPFDSQETGRAVETALISSLQPDLNVDPGPSRWRFRPLGVPADYADRLVAQELGLSDFLSFQGADPTPILFVIINSEDFGGGRVGYDPANPPTDEQLRNRLDRWWQLERLLAGWNANPDASPGLLVGIHGSPGRQIVIAAAHIDRRRWLPAVMRDKGRTIQVPLQEPVDLDAFSLRGRRVARSAGIQFGPNTNQFVMLLNRDGILSGGRKSRLLG